MVESNPIALIGALFVLLVYLFLVPSFGSFMHPVIDGTTETLPPNYAPTAHVVVSVFDFQDILWTVLKIAAVIGTLVGLLLAFLAKASGSG